MKARWVLWPMLAATAFAGAADLHAAPGCETEPIATIATTGTGAQDIVSLPLGDGRVRFFGREVCRQLWGCTLDHSRIGRVDLLPGQISIPVRTERAWRPATGKFDPLALSLVRGKHVGDATLWVLDAVSPRRIWKLEIEGGEIRHPPDGPWFVDTKDEPLADAKDLQAVGNTVYVTRLDPGGGLGGWVKWSGILPILAGGAQPPREPGFRGASGIVDLGGPDLLVSDYWERRLRFVAKNEHGLGMGPRFATGVLSVYPDNLTLDGDRVVIAGQESIALTGAHRLISWLPSPSAVLTIRADQLGEGAKPEPLWRGGYSNGRSVAVAAPFTRGLLLGQTHAAGLLVIRCPDSE